MPRKPKTYKIFIGTPAYQWPCDPHFAMSVQSVMDHPNMEASFRAICGDAHIERARANVLRYYLYKEQDWDFFVNIDWDIEFRAFDLYRALQRMDKFGIDVLGGPYAFKSEDASKKNQPVARFKKSAKEDENHMIDADFVGGGFTIVKDEFMQKMCRFNEDLRFNLNPDLADDYAETWALWNPIIIERPDWPGEKKRELLSEDYSFCYRAHQLNGVVKMDLTIMLKHWAGEKCYTLSMKPVEEGNGQRQTGGTPPGLEAATPDGEGSAPSVAA